jgi:hypothetical protein
MTPAARTGARRHRHLHARPQGPRDDADARRISRRRLPRPANVIQGKDRFFGGKTRMMQLLKLEIERERWGDRKGEFKGEAVFDGEAGTVTLKLTPELAHRLLLLCADAIVDTAKVAATALVVEAQAAIAKDARGGIGAPKA